MPEVSSTLVGIIAIQPTAGHSIEPRISDPIEDRNLGQTFSRLAGNPAAASPPLKRQFWAPPSGACSVTRFQADFDRLSTDLESEATGLLWRIAPK